MWLLLFHARHLNQEGYPTQASGAEIRVANGRSELMAADVHRESDALHQNDKDAVHCMAAVFDDCWHKRTSDKLNVSTVEAKPA